MPFLSEAERRVLLRLARESVLAAVSGHELIGNVRQGCVLDEPCGVFVTLHHRGRLRGCIGVIEAADPLRETVIRCAASAAMHDPRFAPLRLEELGELQIELSVLSPPEITRPDDLQVGLHGILISRGAQRGLLLPQVAVEHHLSREQFLAETCHKAGLPREAWREPDTRIMGFTCQVFSEGDYPKT